MHTEIPDRLENIFRQRFGEAPTHFRSPGRINLIGEHTDYNDGFVMPAAIDKCVYLAMSARSDDRIELYSADFEEAFSGRLENIRRTGTGWADYVLGVVHHILASGRVIGGFNMAVSSDLPIGAGLSSSAAFTCATVFALNDLYAASMDRAEMISIAQKSEHDYAGVMCGIMDQFASMYGRAGYFMKLDCRSMAYEYMPFGMQGVSIVLLNTNVKHSLASSAYNQRRLECAQGLAWVQEAYPDVKALRDVTVEMLERQVLPRDEITYRRCRYVVTENERLQAVCTHLQEGDIRSVGRRMLETHDGLRDMYEVSCRELDLLVEQVRHDPDVLGARMMGGGFGGCTINLVRTEAKDRLVQEISERYVRATSLPLTEIVVSTGNGTERLRP
jgi:galactokinase